MHKTVKIGLAVRFTKQTFYLILFFLLKGSEMKVVQLQLKRKSSISPVSGFLDLPSTFAVYISKCTKL